MLTVTGTATGDVLDDFGKGPDEYPFVLMIQGLGGNDLLQDFDYASAVLDGGAGDDIVVAAAGSGSVGGAVPDGYTTPLVLLGGSGDDTLVFARFSSDTVTLNGGDGDDALVMAGIAAGGVIDGGSGYDRLIMVTGLPSLSQSTVRGIERIDSLGAGGVSFTAGQLDGVTALSGTFNLNFGGTVRLAGKSLSGVTFNLSLDSGFNVRKSILADASVTSGFTVVTGGDIDRVTGGSGADTITVGTSSVAGEILDGGGGRDTLQVGPYADVTLASLRNIESFASNGGRFATAQLARPDTLTGSFFARGAGTLDFAGRTLTDFSLSFAGDSASHVVRFGETVTGGVFVTGGSGADTITGGAGADTILGGIGRDVLTGGTGADRFVFALGAGSADHAAAARVTDFSQAQGDRIGFEPLGVAVGLGADETALEIAVDHPGGLGLARLTLRRVSQA